MSWMCIVHNSNCNQNSSEPLSGGEVRAGAECCRCGRSRVFPLLSLLGFPDVCFVFFAVLTKALWCGEYSTDWELGFKRGGGRSGWGLEANLGTGITKNENDCSQLVLQTKAICAQQLHCSPDWHLLPFS